MRMHRRPGWSRGIALLFFLVWWVGAATGIALGAPTGEHRGFSFDDSAITNAASLPLIREKLKAQIDMVLAVGLPSATIDAFRKVPLLVVPQGSFKSPTPGRYLGGKKQIELTEGFARVGQKPILLHEFMHFYHQIILTNGVKNADILAYYEKAKTLNVYAAGSHMMSNVGEYFATTTTTYLYGATVQEPFKRSKVQEHQPVYFEYLKKLLGDQAGKYDGAAKLGQ